MKTYVEKSAEVVKADKRELVSGPGIKSGYMVTNSDGHQYWMAAEEFESKYKEVE